MLTLRAAALMEGMASVMLIIFVPYYVRSGLEEPSLTIISLIVSLPALSAFGASNFWGAMADITALYRRITGLCMGGFAFCLLLIPLVAHVAVVIALVVVLSLLYGAVRPMLLTQATLLKEEAKHRAISSIFLFESLGFFIGGLLFAQIYDPERIWTGWIVFPIPGVLCLLTALWVYAARADPLVRPAPIEAGASLPGHFLASLKQDLKEVYRSPTLRRLSLVVFAATTSNFCFFSTYYAFFTEELGASTRLMSITISLSTLVGMAFFPLAGRWVETRGGRIVLLATLVLWVVNYSLFILVENAYLASLLFVVPIYPFFLVSTNSLAAEAARSERRGGGLGALAGVSAASMALGAVLGGATGDHLGLRAIPSVSTVVTALALFAFVFLMGLKKGSDEVQS